MSDFIQIRSVKQYFNEFIVEGLKGKTKATEIDLIPIKRAILDAFRREIFEQIVDKIGPEAANMSRDDLAGIETVHNILQQGFRKWRRLCILCGEYGLGSFFQLEDLKRILDEEEDSRNAEDGSVAIEVETEDEDVTDRMEEILPEGEEPVYLNGGVTVGEEVAT